MAVGVRVGVWVGKGVDVALGVTPAVGVTKTALGVAEGMIKEVGEGVEADPAGTAVDVDAGWTHATNTRPDTNTSAKLGCP